MNLAFRVQGDSDEPGIYITQRVADRIPDTVPITPRDRSRTCRAAPEPYAAQAEFSFATDDPPARVRALLVDVARDIPLVSPDRDPRVTTLDGAKFQVSIPLQSPGDKAVVLDAFATRLWYAARRVDLHLNGDLADDWNSPARLQDALHEIAPILSLRSEDAEALAASALSRNDPVGLTALTRNVFG